MATVIARALAPAARDAAKEALAGLAGDEMASMADMWGTVLSGGAQFAAKLPGTLYGLVLKFALLLLALLVLGILVAVIALAVWLYRVLRPRMPLPTRAAPLDGWLAARCADLAESIGALAAGLAGADGAWMLSLGGPDACAAQGADGGGGDCGAADVGAAAAELQAACAALGSRQLSSDLPLWFTFKDAVLKLNFLNRYDLRWNAPDFSTGGDLDAAVLQDFLTNVIVPLGVVQSAAGKLSAALDAMPDLPTLPWFTDGAYALVGHVHRTRLIMGYWKVVNRMLKARRGHLPFAIWTVYYAPYVVDIFEHRIPEVWEKTPFQMVQDVKDGMNWWFGLGVPLGKLPCSMAFTDPVERAQRCGAGTATGEGFVSDADPAKQRAADAWEAAQRAAQDRLGGRTRARRILDAGADVVEGVSIGGALSSIVGFIKNMKFVGLAIASIGKQFTSNPFNAIVSIIGLVLGSVLGLLLIILYMLLTVTVAPVLVVLYAILATFVGALLYTVFQIFLAIVIAIGYFLLWVPDLLTGGMVVKLLRCENLPDAWATDVAFEGGDAGWYRLGACFAPCGARFRPSGGGCLCQALPPYRPSLCPQQQLARAALGMPLVGHGGSPVDLERYQANAAFLKLSVGSKEAFLRRVYENKADWYQPCFEQLSSYDYVARHVCTDVKRFAGGAQGAWGLGLSSADQAHLRALCRECFCSYRASTVHRDRTNVRAVMRRDGDFDRPAGMCARLQEGYGADGSEDSDAGGGGMSGPGVAVLRRIALVGLVSISALCVLFSMLRASDHMVEELLLG